MVVRVVEHLHIAREATRKYRQEVGNSIKRHTNKLEVR